MRSNVVEVYVIGQAAVFFDTQKASTEDLVRVERFTFPIVFVLLVLAFGSAVAAGLPLVLGAACVVVGLAVTRLGRSSVTYRLGMFRSAEQVQPITALGHWVHVYVDRTSRKPVPIPEPIRSLLSMARVDR